MAMKLYKVTVTNEWLDEETGEIIKETRELKDDSIKKQDFLKFNTDKGNILVIGNPPFGHANDLSLKFINNAAKFARTIAFILPKSCQKETFINRLDKN